MSAVSPTTKLVDPDFGEGVWPVEVSVQLPTDERVPALIHIADIHSMARNKPGEVRWQNPGQDHPVIERPGRISLLLGIHAVPEFPNHGKTEECSICQRGVGTVLVSAGDLRVGKDTRFSVRFQEDLLAEAWKEGVATYTSGTEEVLTALHPALFPGFVLSQREGVEFSATAIAEGVRPTGLLEERSESSGERARVASFRIVRDAGFRHRVKVAYGDRCALCRLGHGLVEAAHIYPVSAPGSTDRLSNGVALCPNHHKAFDAHLIFIDPDDLTVTFHESVLAEENAATRWLTDLVADHIGPPSSEDADAFKDNLIRRYKHFEGLYDWGTR